MSRPFPIGFAGARMELHTPGHRRVVGGAGAAGSNLEHLNASVRLSRNHVQWRQLSDAAPAIANEETADPTAAARPDQV
jgi:hypothetical protein